MLIAQSKWCVISQGFSQGHHIKVEKIKKGKRTKADEKRVTSNNLHNDWSASFKYGLINQRQWGIAEGREIVVLALWLNWWWFDWVLFYLFIDLRGVRFELKRKILLEECLFGNKMYIKLVQIESIFSNSFWLAPMNFIAGPDSEVLFGMLQFCLIE